MIRGPVGPPRRSGSMVGRRVEIGWLRTRFEQAMQGLPQLVLIEGEPGIGKSRLAAELLDDARRAGCTVIRGRCYEHLRFAYLPLREALFEELARWSADRPDYRADAARLQTLLDEDGAAATPSEVAGTDVRARQLLALTRLTIGFSRERPSVVLVDDVHWADDATVDLLRHLLFRFEDEQAPLLVITTARTDPGARAANGVERIRSEARTAALTLRPLEPLEATELARTVAGDLSLERARALAVASGGNPLLVEALARHAAADPTGRATSGAAHPMTAAIEADLDRLSPAARTLTRVAAVLVPRCSSRLLVQVSDLDPDDAAAALREALSMGVLVDDGTRVDFAHPLFAHLTASRTSPTERRTIHTRTASALLECPEDHEVRTIAHHLVGAGGDVDRATVAEYARRAADAALAAAAWADAATFYEAAIDADIDRAPAERAELHQLAGLSRRGNLELAQAVTHFEAAIRELGEEGDSRALAELHTWRIRCAVGTPDLMHVITDVGRLEALAPVVEEVDPSLAAEAYVELSQAYWIARNLPGSEAAAHRAIDLGTRTGASAAVSRGAMALAVPQWARYDLRESLASLQAACSDSDDGLGADRAGGARFRVPLVLAWLGRLDEAAATAEECLGIAESVGYPLEAGLPLAALALVSLTRGEFDRAEQHAHRALVVQRLSGYHWAAGLYLPALAQACLWRGAFDGAADALDAWAETAGDAELLLVDLLRRQVDTARRQLPVQGAPLLPLPQTPAVGADTWAAVTLTIARADGQRLDAEGAHRLFAEMEARGGTVVSGMGMLVSRLCGVTADLAGDEEGAIDALERACVVADRIGARPERARALVDLAAIRLRRSEQAAAANLLDDAVTELEALGMYAEARRAAAVDGSHRPPLATPIGSTSRSHDVLASRAVILFTDVVDSTRLTEELGNARYRDRARRLESLLMSTIAVHRGSVVSGINLGDGMIGIFHDALDALRTALAVAQNAASVADLHLRLGIHAGDILVDGTRIYGGPVNYAARVCALAGQDEVLVSARVRDDVGTTAQIAFVDRGEHALKGISGLQRMYAALDTAEKNAH